MLICTSILTACSSVQSQKLFPVPKVTTTLTPFFPVTNTPDPPTATSLPTITATLTPLPSPTSTPTPLPVFQSALLYKTIKAVEYLQDTCSYLQMRWDPDNAKPGTIVVPIMFHGIRKDPGTVTDNITVTQKYFEATMAHARELGFETITIAQLENFLQHNAYIPPRSLLLIIDDRRLGTVRDRFMPILEKYNWTLIMAYITGVLNQQEWQQVKDVLASGYVTIEAHGYLHNGNTYIYDYTPEDIVRSEILKPIDAFRENLGYRPTAIIWPGGDFTAGAVEIAREAGYQVGFTAFPRGPIMFNWVPLGEKERPVGDPLMLLPRYWSTAAYKNIDDAVGISEAAATYAEAHYLDELAWFQNYCKGYQPIPRPTVEDCEVCTQ